MKAVQEGAYDAQSNVGVKVFQMLDQHYNVGKMPEGEFVSFASFNSPCSSIDPLLLARS